MIPKIASALARVLDPIKPIQRPGQSVTLTKSQEGGEGGHGPLGYDSQGQTGSKNPDSDEKLESKEDPQSEPLQEKSGLGGLPLQSGLTQVILELNNQRHEHVSGTAVQSYETGAKEQKKNCKLPKGSMLDKKAG